MAKQSHWAEFFGGPYDGTMAELPWRYIPETENMAIRVSDPETPSPRGEGWFRPGKQVGRYMPTGWADEELGIVRMEWHPG